MSVKIGELFVDVKANIAEFVSGIDTATAKGAAFGSAIGVSIGSLATNAFATLGQKALEVAEAFPKMANEAIAFGENLSLQSEKLGIGVERLSEYGYAATLTNLSTDQMTTTLARFSKQVELAAQGGVGAKLSLEALRKVGIDLTDLNLPMDQLFQKFAAGYTMMAAGQEKTQVGMQLAGRVAFEATPFFNMIGNSMNAVAAGAQKVGVAMSDSTAQGARDAAESAKKLDLAWTGLKLTIGEQLIGPMESLTTALRGLVTFVNENPPNWKAFFSGIPGGILGGAGALALGGSTSQIAAAAKIGAQIGETGLGVVPPWLQPGYLIPPALPPAPPMVLPKEMAPPNIAFSKPQPFVEDISKEVKTLSDEMAKYAIKIPVEFAQLREDQIKLFEGQLSGIQAALSKATSSAQVDALTASFERLQHAIGDVAAFDKLLHPLADLTEKMKELQSVHVSDTDLVKVYGDELIKLGEAGGKAAGQLSGHAAAVLDLALARKSDMDELLLEMRAQGERSLQIYAEQEGLGLLNAAVQKHNDLLRESIPLSVQLADAARAQAQLFGTDTFTFGGILDPLAEFKKAQAQISQAFSAFGSTSGFDLAGLADAAQKNFAIVTASGQASARTLLKDWIATQQAVRDAAQAGAGAFTWSKEQSAALTAAEVQLAKMTTDEQNAASAMKLFHQEIRTAMDSLNTGVANSIVAGKGLADVFISITDELGKWAIKFLVLIPLEKEFLNAFTTSTSSGGGLFGFLSSLVGGATAVPSLSKVPFGPSWISGPESAFGNLSFPGFASGGPVPPDIPIMVGEKGPEIFVPSTSGAALPHEGLLPTDETRQLTSNAMSMTAPEMASGKAPEFTAGQPKAPDIPVMVGTQGAGVFIPPTPGTIISNEALVGAKETDRLTTSALSVTTPELASGNTPEFAVGQAATPDVPLMVGEQGPGIFVPPSPGTVIPHESLVSAKETEKLAESASSMTPPSTGTAQLPGFAAGGAVLPDIPVAVGESGPEVFVPSATGMEPAPLPEFASGGPVVPDIPVEVGEKGPEIFVPSSTGETVPNQGLGRGSAAGLPTGLLPSPMQPSFLPDRSSNPGAEMPMGMQSAPLPGFASGGPVLPDVPIIVGENGPEKFVPSSAGTIIPNEKLSGGAGTQITQHIAIDARYAQPGVAEQLQKVIPGVIKTAVQMSVASMRDIQLRSAG